MRLCTCAARMGNKFVVEVDLGATVLTLKGFLVDKSAIPADQQRLIYKGRVLKDEQTLNSYGECSDGGWVDWLILVFFLEGVWRVESSGGFRLLMSCTCDVELGFVGSCERARDGFLWVLTSVRARWRVCFMHGNVFL